MNIDLGIIVITNFYQLIEFILLMVIIIIQFTHTWRVNSKIKLFRDTFNTRLFIKYGCIERLKLIEKDRIFDNIIFEDSLEEDQRIVDLIDDNVVRIAVVATTSKNSILLRIRDALNSYLINNYGSVVSFNIIKDIIDREIKAVDEEISNRIPTPLYLGLAATMLGIIFGLLSMPSIESGNFSGAINALIDGVKIAMLASLSGLVFTTYLSSFIYNNAKGEVVRGQNKQISYLQATLLPELIKTEDTGVTGLKASLDRFASQATVVADDVKRAADQTGENINSQLEVIKKIESIDMMKISKTNLDLFNKLENNMESFNKFSEYIRNMELIASNLNDFSERTKDIDKIIGEISSSQDKSEKLTQFLTSHFEKIESAGGAALRAVDNSDSHFRNAIQKLEEEVSKRIMALNKIADDSESTLKETFENVADKLKEITDDHLNEFKEAYSDVVPQFNQLDHLNTLPLLLEEMKKNSIRSDQTSELLIEGIIDLGGSVKDLQNLLKKESVLSNLRSNISNRGLFKRLFRNKNRNTEILDSGNNGGASNNNVGFFRKILNKFSKTKKNSVES